MSTQHNRTNGEARRSRKPKVVTRTPLLVSPRADAPLRRFPIALGKHDFRPLSPTNRLANRADRRHPIKRRKPGLRAQPRKAAKR